MDMTDFEAERPRLTAIATRILGSAADADEVLQEAWLRLSRTDNIDDPPAWLTTVVTRLCLDDLRKRRTRSEAEADAPADPALVDPEADALLAERVGGAMQVVLDALAPAERAAFVLHDVFGYPFDEISVCLGRSGTAVRQLASRARRKVRGAPEAAAEKAARAESRRIVDAFLAAARGGDLGTLVELLAPEVVVRADGGALLPSTVLRGREEVAQGAMTFARAAELTRPALVNGAPGAVTLKGGQIVSVAAFTVAGGRITALDILTDPERLSRLDPAVLDG